MTLEELGLVIRSKREGLGLSIEEVASHIKVSARTLKAIEQGSVQGLPHAVYTRGFIRSYGTLVGVDLEQLNIALETIFPPEEFEDASPRMTPLMNRVPAGEMRKRFAALFLLLAFVVALAVGGWHICVTYGEDIINLVKQPFSAVNPAGGVTPLVAVANASLESPRVTDLHSAVALHPEEPAMPMTAGSSSEPLLAEPEQPQQSPEQPAVLPEGLNEYEQSAIAANKQIVYVSAIEDCYLGITADNGKLMHHMLKSQENYPVVFSGTLKLLIGNAGGINIRYNGKDMGEIGAKAKPRLLLFPM